MGGVPRTSPAWRSRRKERHQVGTLRLNEEVLKENWITGCCVKMQPLETALMHVLFSSGATAGDKGGLVAGLEHFCRSCWA